MNQREKEELEKWIDIITEKAASYGLDFYPTHFEVVPDYVIYELGSYGLPARFSHWTFGRDYHRQKTSYEYGMSKIYEIVFNSDPCQAFLMESNSMLSHKFVVAHVLGHNDFFKNNVYFEHTDRRMITTVRLHAERIHQYELEFGEREVEEFLDAALSIEEHIDPTQTAKFRIKSKEEYEQDRRKETKQKTEYDDLWEILRGDSQKLPVQGMKLPPEPEKDLLGFLMKYAPELEMWQRDILNMLREEMLYFVPQIRTKIINEGWASFWHERILTDLELSPEEHIEFRRLHSSVISPGSKTSINPYYVGYTILRDIESRWNGELSSDFTEKNWSGDCIVRPSGEGMKKIFEVRRDESDVSFLRKYLSEELVQRLDLYTYRQIDEGDELVWMVEETDWRKVRDAMLDSMTNFGVPIIYVEDADYNRHGELLLTHAYDNKPLDSEYAVRTLANIYKLWKRPVHLRTERDGVQLLISHYGDDWKEEEI